MSSNNSSTNISSGISQVTSNAFSYAQEGILRVGQNALQGVRYVTYYAKEVAKSSDATRQTLRACGAALRTFDALKVIQAPVQLLKTIDTFNCLIFSTRLVYSLQDLFAGKITEKIRNGNLLGAAIDLSFLSGKALFNAEYYQGLNVIHFGGVARQIAKIPVFGRVVNLFDYPLIDYSFLSGCSLCLVDQNNTLQQIERERSAKLENLRSEIQLASAERKKEISAEIEKIVYEMQKKMAICVIDIVNLVAECAAIALGLLGVSTTLVIAPLGCIAASTAVVSFLLSEVRSPDF